MTTERIVVENGLLSKRMDQIDIYRINDYVVERPFGQRMMGTGNIVLNAMDASTPQMRLDGLKTDVRELYERPPQSDGAREEAPRRARRRLRVTLLANSTPSSVRASSGL